ncbi:hypothetical protein GQ43DRAFT_268883 [Delitschia confertaspora ATCC 74209]|uniref:Uncharacterized protein n=1 Tax=Delitschia confertaspora ATCC 74209 TaxID=1513339 RepID=A0A9P4JGF8_9PLEO|nr:hypothetical protein GQ43DRAFT_268883 [Delitschia confertaspora ATCC 74209]
MIICYFRDLISPDLAGAGRFVVVRGVGFGACRRSPRRESARAVRLSSLNRLRLCLFYMSGYNQTSPPQGYYPPPPDHSQGQVQQHFPPPSSGAQSYSSPPASSPPAGQQYPPPGQHQQQYGAPPQQHQYPPPGAPQHQYQQSLGGYGAPKPSQSPQPGYQQQAGTGAQQPQFSGATATSADDVGTFNGGSYRVSHRDTNSIVTIQLAVGCPVTAKPGKSFH